MVGELNRDEMDQLLYSEIVGRIGCQLNGQTYVIPVEYVYDGRSVYGRAGMGRKIEIMRKDSRVCFEVDRVETLEDWRSVIAWGHYEELRGAEAERAEGLLIRRFVRFMAATGAPRSTD